VGKGRLSGAEALKKWQQEKWEEQTEQKLPSEKSQAKKEEGVKPVFLGALSTHRKKKVGGESSSEDVGKNKGKETLAEIGMLNRKHH